MPRPGGNPDSLKSWRPGQSGNPKGAPKSFDTFKGIMERLLEESTEAKPPASETAKERICRIHVQKAMRGDIASTSLVIERTEGKVADKLISEQTVNVVPWLEADDDDFDAAREQASEDDEA